MSQAIEFLAQRDQETRRWTGSAWIGSKKIAETPDTFPTKAAAIAAIKERV